MTGDAAISLEVSTLLLPVLMSRLCFMLLLDLGPFIVLSTELMLYLLLTMLPIRLSIPLGVASFYLPPEVPASSVNTTVFYVLGYFYTTGAFISFWLVVIVTFAPFYVCEFVVLPCLTVAFAYWYCLDKG